MVSLTKQNNKKIGNDLDNFNDAGSDDEYSNQTNLKSNNKLDGKIYGGAVPDEDLDIDEDDGDYDEDDDDLDDDDDDDDEEDSANEVESDVKELNIDIKDSLGYGDQTISPIQSDVESEDEDYFQKFDTQLRNDYIETTHPESLIKNHEEISILIQQSHKTLPFLTKYEKTRILGQRAKQINSGDRPYIDVPYDIIDGYLIAELELKAKKLPLIVCRPIPDGTAEYWKLSDLEIL